MLIFDIGASNGIFSKKYSKNATVYAFEPNKTNIIKLKENCGNINNYNIIEKAISDKEGEVDFFEANYTNSSSLLPFTYDVVKWKNPSNTTPMLKTVNKYKVSTIRLDNFIEQENYHNMIIDFIKIDTQGHDLNVIKSLGKYIKNVREILCEVQITNFELYKDQSNKNDLLSYMKENNFEIRKIQPWSHNQEENIWFINKNFDTFLNLE
jgi:FkbM family methyltransferase